METLNKLSAGQLEKAAFLLKTIAHPVRLGVLDLLQRHDQLSVNEIAERLNCEQSLTSHHLTMLRLKGILACRREGKHMYYSLKLRDIVQIIACLENCECRLL